MQLSLQGKSNKVLSKEMTATMLTPYIDKSAALGVFIDDHDGEKYFQHGGANEGLRCQYFGSLQNGNGVVVMVNSDNGMIMQEIVNSVATVYNWKNFYKPVRKKVAKVNIDTLKQYVGEYMLQGPFYVTLQGNQLSISDQDKVPFKMYFTSDKDCFVMEVPAELQFHKNEQGLVDALVIKQNGREVKAMKK
jgi:hypothetical protein